MSKFDALDAVFAPSSGQSPSPETDKFSALDRIFADSDQRHGQRVEHTINQVAGVNPDQAAKAQSLSSTLGLPLDVVERNPDAAASQARAREVLQLSQRNPVLRRHLQDPGFAKVAHDDVENLAELGAAFIPAERSFLDATAGVIRRGYLRSRLGLRLALADAGVLYGPEDRAELAAGAQDLQRQIEALGASDEIQAALADISSADGFGEAFGEIITNPRAVAEVVLESMGGSAPALALTLAGSGAGPGGTATGAGVGAFAVEYVNVLQEAVAEIEGDTSLDAVLAIDKVLQDKELMDATREKAIKRGIPIAMFDALTAGLAGRLLSGAQATTTSVSTRTAGELGLQAAGGAAGETGAQLANGEYSPGEILLEALAEIPTAGVEVPGNYVRAMRSARNAEAYGEQLDRINKLAEASKVRERAPDQFAAFVEAAAEDGAQNLYVSGEVLMQSGMAPRLEEVLPGITAEAQRAALAGQEVQIRMTDFAAKIAGTDLAEGLIDDLRIEGEDFTRRQAKEYVANQSEELNAEIERTLQDVEQRDAFQQAATQVEGAVFEGLKAAGRSEDVSRVNAQLHKHFFSTLAVRLGTTPDALFDRFGLKITGQSPIGDQVLNQVLPEAMPPGWRMGDGQSIASAFRGDRRVAAILIGQDQRTSQTLPGLSTFSHSVDSSALQHLKRRHTDRKTESDRGQLPIGEQDVARIPEIVNTFDDIRHGLVSERHRLPVVAYVKEFEDGVYLYLEEVRRKRRDLTLLSMRKYPPGADAQKILESAAADQYVRNDGGHGNDATPAWMLGQEKPLEQSDDAVPRGTFDPATNTISLLKGADLSTFLHESGHFFLEVQFELAAEIQKETRLFGDGSVSEQERQFLKDNEAILKWFGVNDIDTWFNLSLEEKRSYHERWAESFEAYLLEGKAPSLELAPAFQRFRSWLVDVYRSLKQFLKGHPEAGNLNDEVRSVMDRLLATDEQIELAQQAQSMMPIFENAEQAGMTPEEFARYQALGQTATDDAKDQLEARSLRDLKWTRNAKNRALKALQREAREVRREVRTRVAEQVKAEPIYRAWQFLRAKITEQDQARRPGATRAKSDPNVVDPSQDSLFVAIAKLGGLDKDEVIAKWGADPKDKPQSGVFGKPVWRREGGRAIDDMLEALAARGYLGLDEHGKADVHEFEDRFFAENRGDRQYSNEADPSIYGAGGPLKGEDLVIDQISAGRLDRGALADLDLDEAIDERLKALKMTAKDGIHPDLVAEWFGFESGAELATKLAEAPPPTEVIEARTDEIMLDQHSELATPEALERAADEAIHNEARIRAVATEANALAKATGRPKILAKAAKAFAEQIIGAQRIRDLSAHRYTLAERKAAQAADKAMRKNNLPEAAAEKRNQLIHGHAARASHQARSDIEAGIRYLRRLGKPGVRQNIDPDYADQIDALLEQYELKPLPLKEIDKRASLRKWLAQSEESGLTPDVPDWLVDASKRTHYKNLTVDELRGLIDTVKQIEHMGRLKNRLLTAKDKREFAAVEAEIAQSIVDNGGKARPIELEETGRVRRWFEGFLAGNRKLSSLARQMDGGEELGPMYRYLIRTMNDQGTWEANRNAEATEALAKLYKPILDMKGGTAGDKRYIEAIGRSLSRGARLSIALNWGNVDNRQRLLGGNLGSEANPFRLNAEQADAILKTLTREEWQFVQGVWDFIDGYWTQIAEKQRRVYGVTPEKVQASGFTRTLADGSEIELKGGYYPIKYDATKDDKAAAQDIGQIADEVKRGAYTASTTRRGHTQARQEQVNRPLRLSLDVITEHVAQVTHDLAWHEWLIDANRLLRSQKIAGAVRDHYGNEVLRTMREALVGIAGAELSAQSAIDQALLHLRANVSRATMGVSLTTAFLQPFGLLQSVVRVGPKYMLRGMARWGGSVARFEGASSWVYQKSDFMQRRRQTFNRELYEIRGRVSQGKGKARTAYDASLFWIMQRMQLIADVPTWMGAYEKAQDQGLNEADSVALADRAVLESQGGGQTKDLSGVQRNHPMLTMFYSYFNVTLQLTAESTARTNFKSPLSTLHWMGDMLMLNVIPALGPALILAMLRGDDLDDPDELGKQLLKWQVGYIFGLVPGLREMSGAIEGYDYAGPPVGRVIKDAGSLLTQLGQGEADEGLALSIVRLIGTAFGIPVTQLVRSYRGWKDWEEDGEGGPQNVLVGPPRQD